MREVGDIALYKIKDPPARASADRGCALAFAEFTLERSLIWIPR